jgi:hypothetical protein
MGARMDANAILRHWNAFHHLPQVAKEDCDAMAIARGLLKGIDQWWLRHRRKERFNDAPGWPQKGVLNYGRALAD